MDRADKPRIVVIGGGTGSFTLLGGLKHKTPLITSLVNMADDGGSTGQLRDELGVLPPGDVRQCLVALANAPAMRDLFNYRFTDGTLSGHAFGNLFLTALEKMTGDFAQGVELASQVLNITGSVEPVTLTNVKLILRGAQGREVRGESAITEDNFNGERPNLSLEPAAIANPKALRAINRADIVVVAPGNLYGSLAPALIVPGIGKALAESPAVKIYVCNLVTKPGQTDGFQVDDFADEIERFAGTPFLDYVLYNTDAPDRELLDKYAAEGELAVGASPAKLQRQHYRAVGTGLLAETIWQGTDKADPLSRRRTLIRHDSNKVADAIMEVYGRSQLSRN